MGKALLPIVLWSLVFLVNAYFIYRFPFRHFNSASFNRPFGPLLTAHIIFGIVALLTGPLQFIADIRKKRPYLHRQIGKIYLFAVLLGSICAIVLSIQHNIIIQKRLAFGTGLLGLAAAWLVTSGMAVWAIRNRNFVQHREWMVRSFVVTCGFTFYRILFLAAISYLPAGNVEYKNELSGILAWSCWAIPLLATEIILQAIKIKRETVMVAANNKTMLAE